MRRGRLQRRANHLDGAPGVERLGAPLDDSFGEFSDGSSGSASSSSPPPSEPLLSVVLRVGAPRSCCGDLFRGMEFYDAFTGRATNVMCV